MRFATARLLVAISLGIIAMAFVDFVLGGNTVWRSTLAYAMIVSVLLLLLNRLLVGNLPGASAFRRKVLVLGAGARAKRLLKLSERQESGFCIVGFIAMTDAQPEIEGAIRRGEIENLTS
jgi:FlaA1/EpsC-like NDP-sugar epimerase